MQRYEQKIVIAATTSRNSVCFVIRLDAKCQKAKIDNPLNLPAPESDKQFAFCINIKIKFNLWNNQPGNCDCRTRETTPLIKQPLATAQAIHAYDIENVGEIGERQNLILKRLITIIRGANNKLNYSSLASYTALLTHFLAFAIANAGVRLHESWQLFLK